MNYITTDCVAFVSTIPTDRMSTESVLSKQNHMVFVFYPNTLKAIRNIKDLLLLYILSDFSFSYFGDRLVDIRDHSSIFQEIQSDAVVVSEEDQRLIESLIVSEEELVEMIKIVHA